MKDRFFYPIPQIGHDSACACGFFLVCAFLHHTIHLLKQLKNLTEALMDVQLEFLVG
jgi:hypothetical protein